MRITQSDVTMSASSASTYVHAERMSIRRFTVAEPPPQQQAQAGAVADISEEGRRRSEEAGSISDQVEDAINGDPWLRLVRLLIERLTGRSIDTGARDGDEAGGARDGRHDHGRRADGVEPRHEGRNDAGRRPEAGVGVEIDYQEVTYRSESVSFQASGSVVTADGARIDFDVDMNLQWEHLEARALHVEAGARQRKDPLVLNLDGGSARLTEARFAFDLDADGSDDDVPLLAGGSALLVFDRNGNGTVDDGSELFGALSGDGFADLAALDTDGDTWIDEDDAAFTGLRVWQPDADGAGTLRTLAEAGVGAISVGSASTPFTLRGADGELGVLRSTGVYLGEDGGGGTVQQVDFTV